MITHACRLPWMLLLGLALAGPVRAQLHADFQTTKGSFTVELFHQDVPRTVASFVSLVEGTRAWTDSRTNRVRQGVPFYDGIIFHRVAALSAPGTAPTLIIQGGSTKGDGRDGPGYKFPDEFSKDAAGQLLHKHVTGALSMANSGIHTNGSQFFLVGQGPPLTFLDDRHTVFGQVAAGPFGTAAEGQAVVDAISTVPLDNERPTTDVVMEHVTIRRVGASAMAFDALAWDLPIVGGAVHADATFVPGTPGPLSGIDLSYPSLIHHAYLYEDSTDLLTWTRLQLSVGPTTAIRLVSDTRTFSYTGLGGTPTGYLRVRSIDYSALVARTSPVLSANASLRFLFSTPAGGQLTLTRAAAGGAWAVPGSAGQLASTTYPVATGDADLFSPRLGAMMIHPLPWTPGVTLKSLVVSLTFEAGSITKGYFTFQGATNANPSTLVTGKGVFSVLVP